ncbi:hypothetical protein [Saccharibacillus sacchari]|uniref:Uncharacterized protein n=1 Tax=Saccharibacillus sacchari TaxID=456493 RepID=A0ACC6PJD1_9BACL
MFFIIFLTFGLIATFFKLAMYTGVFLIISIPLNKFWMRFCKEKNIPQGWMLTVKVLFWILFVIVIIWKVPLGPIGILKSGEQLIGFPD